MTDRTEYMREYMRKRRAVNKNILKFKEKSVNKKRKHFNKEIEKDARLYQTSPTQVWMMGKIENALIPEHYRWWTEKILSGDRYPRIYLMYRLTKCPSLIRDVFMEALIRFYNNESLYNFLVSFLKLSPEHIENMIVQMMDPDKEVEKWKN